MLQRYEENASYTPFLHIFYVNVQLFVFKMSFLQKNY